MSKFLTVFLFLVVGAVFGQEGGGEQGVCECGEVAQLHEKCVQDWHALDAIRAALEQQVRDTEFHANERCNGQLEQVRGEIEQVRNEGNRQLELTRSESQAHLNELSQCQTQHQELIAQFEEQGNTHRRLQEASQQLEDALANVKSEKTSLENSVRDKDSALDRLKKEKMAAERELEATKKTLDEMVAARAIITIDWELLNERVDEYKAKAEVAMKDVAGFCGEKLEFAKGKVMEFYTYLETEVYPQAKQTVEKDVIPFLEKSWIQAKNMWEDIYSPYRPTVNEKLKMAKVESKKFYKQNLEPHVKAYELDVHAAKAKKTAEEYATLAHNKLVDGIKTSTKTALTYAKLQEESTFSRYAVEKLEILHKEHELFAFYIESFLAVVIAYYLLKLLFRRKKKKSQKSLKKQQWKEKEAAAAKAKQSPQQPNSKKAMKNGKKHK